jgi:hypothetical protein
VYQKLLSSFRIVACSDGRQHNNRGMLFSVRSVQTCYKKDNLSNELAVRQSPAGKNMDREAKNIVSIRPQATTVKDTLDGEHLVRAVMICRVYELATAL